MGGQVARVRDSALKVLGSGEGSRLGGRDGGAGGSVWGGEVLSHELSG